MCRLREIKEALRFWRRSDLRHPLSSRYRLFILLAQSVQIHDVQQHGSLLTYTQDAIRTSSNGRHSSSGTLRELAWKIRATSFVTFGVDSSGAESFSADPIGAEAVGVGPIGVDSPLDDHDSRPPNWTIGAEPAGAETIGVDAPDDDEDLTCLPNWMSRKGVGGMIVGVGGTGPLLFAGRLLHGMSGAFGSR